MSTGVKSVVADALNRRDVEALSECWQLCERVGAVRTRWFILVNITEQRLHLLEFAKKTSSEEKKCEGQSEGSQIDFSNYLFNSYPISSSAKGTGQIEGSGQTPLGLHCIQEKIGDKADPFAIFKSREWTGKVAEPQPGGNDIVGRILWLKGMQGGWNLGSNEEGKAVDTYLRYIYIHGTNDIEHIGEPVSAGCVRMVPRHVIALFNKVPAGTLVYIYA